MNSERNLDRELHQSWLDAWRDNFTPWECHGPHKATAWLWDRVQSYIPHSDQQDSGEQQAQEPTQIVLPGAGRAHDSSVFLKAGLRVRCVDLAPQARSYAEEEFADYGDAFIYTVGDVMKELEVRDRVSFLFNRAFFCALHPRQRHPFLQAARDHLQAGGFLLAVLFGKFRPDDYDMNAPPGDRNHRSLRADLRGGDGSPGSSSGRFKERSINRGLVDFDDHAHSRDDLETSSLVPRDRGPYFLTSDEILSYFSSYFEVLLLEPWSVFSSEEKVGSENKTKLSANKAANKAVSGAQLDKPVDRPVSQRVNKIDDRRKQKTSAALSSAMGVMPGEGWVDGEFVLIARRS